MFKKVLLSVCLVAALVCMGCAIGVKENNNLLFVCPVAIPEAAKGAPVIATNKEIPLAILNQKDKIFRQKVTGYVLVDPWTWAEMVEVYNAEGR